MIKEQWQYRAVLCHTVLHSTVLHCVAQHCAAQFDVVCAAQCSAALHRTHCTVLCALHCAVLRYTVLRIWPGHPSWEHVPVLLAVDCWFVELQSMTPDTYTRHTHTHCQLSVKSLLTRTTVEMCILLCLSWWTRHNIMHKN